MVGNRKENTHVTKDEEIVLREKARKKKFFTLSTNCFSHGSGKRGFWFFQSTRRCGYCNFYEKSFFKSDFIRCNIQKWVHKNLTCMDLSFSNSMKAKCTYLYTSWEEAERKPHSSKECFGWYYIKFSSYGSHRCVDTKSFVIMDETAILFEGKINTKFRHIIDKKAPLRCLGRNSIFLKIFLFYVMWKSRHYFWCSKEVQMEESRRKLKKLLPSNVFACWKSTAWMDARSMIYMAKENLDPLCSQQTFIFFSIELFQLS